MAGRFAKTLMATAVVSASISLGIGFASAADWKLALPTESGLAFVDPQGAGAQAVTMAGTDFGQVDEVIAFSGGAKLLTSISSVGSGSETIMAYDTRILAPTGLTSFGSSPFGIIPNQTIVSPDGQSILIATFDGLVQQVDPNSGKVLAKVQLDGTPFALTLDSKGTGLVVGLKTETDKGYQLSIATLKLGPLAADKSVALGTEKISDEEVKYSMQIVGNSAMVYAPGRAYVGDLTTFKAKKISPVYNKKSLDPIGSSSDGKYLVCRYGDGNTGMFIYYLSVSKVAKRILMKDPVYAVGSQDGTSLYVSSAAKGTLGVFDISTLSPTKSFLVPGLLGSVRLLNAPDSDLPVPKTIGGNIVVLCDSFLGGSGDAKDTFSVLLGKKLSADGYGVPVINSCGSEDSSASFNEGFDDRVDSYNPKVAVIEIGQADLALAEDEAAQNEAVKAVGEALSATVDKAVKSGLTVILVSPNDKLKGVYEEASKKFSVPFVEGAKGFKASLDKAYPVIVERVASLAK